MRLSVLSWLGLQTVRTMCFLWTMASRLFKASSTQWVRLLPKGWSAVKAALSPLPPLLPCTLVFSAWENIPSHIFSSTMSFVCLQPFNHVSFLFPRANSILQVEEDPVRVSMPNHRQPLFSESELDWFPDYPAMTKYSCSKRHDTFFFFFFAKNHLIHKLQIRKFQSKSQVGRSPTCCSSQLWDHSLNTPL